MKKIEYVLIISLIIILIGVFTLLLPHSRTTKSRMYTSSVTPVISIASVSNKTDEFSAVINPKLSVTWDKDEISSTRLYYKHKFDEFTVYGKERKGTLFVSDNDLYLVEKLENKTYLGDNGWILDNYIAGGGSAGDYWGYFKQEGNKRKIIMFDYFNHAAHGAVVSPDTCPCKYTITVFISDSFPFPST